jgi:hypothetical protein
MRYRETRPIKFAEFFKAWTVSGDCPYAHPIIGYQSGHHTNPKSFVSFITLKPSLFIAYKFDSSFRFDENTILKPSGGEPSSSARTELGAPTAL